MKSYFYCVATVVALIAMQFNFATVGNAQTYQDILKQVSSPGIGNTGSPAGSSVPTINSVFQDPPTGSSTRVPSAVINGGQLQQQNGIGSNDTAVRNGAAPGGMVQDNGAMMNGGVVNGGYSNGTVLNGGQINNNCIGNGYSNGQIMGGGGQFINNGQMMHGSMVGNGQMMGATPRGVITGTGSMMQPRNVYSPAYSAPVYVPGQNFGNSNSFVAAPNHVAAQSVVAPNFVTAPSAGCGNTFANANANAGSGRNLVYGVNGLIFDRDYEDDVFLVRNAAGDSLRSTDADVGNLGGIEFFFGTRTDDGNGLDVRYWGLFTEPTDYALAGASFSSYIPDLGNVTWPSNGRTILDVFNGSTLHNIRRSNEIHNVEVNSLRNGGCFTTRGGRNATYELLGGFRWFEFNESFEWDVTSPSAPLSLAFDNNVQNTLLGFQLGGRSEVMLSNKMRLNIGTKLGVFNNRSRVEQILTDDVGTYAVVDGQAYNFRNSKNDVSLLGELNLGAAYHFNPCSRLNIGYRAIGVSGIALAPNQLNNFNYVPAITNIQSNADLILHGAVFGLEFCR